jgi:hypothetical protein
MIDQFQSSEEHATHVRIGRVLPHRLDPVFEEVVIRVPLQLGGRFEPVEVSAKVLNRANFSNGTEASFVLAGTRGSVRGSGKGGGRGRGVTAVRRVVCSIWGTSLAIVIECPASGDSMSGLEQSIQFSDLPDVL